MSPLLLIPIIAAFALTSKKSAAGPSLAQAQCQLDPGITPAVAAQVQALISGQNPKVTPAVLHAASDAALHAGLPMTAKCLADAALAVGRVRPLATASVATKQTMPKPYLPRGSQGVNQPKRPLIPREYVNKPLIPRNYAAGPSAKKSLTPSQIQRLAAGIPL